MRTVTGSHRRVTVSRCGMPLFRSGKHEAPPWCEVESFEIIELAENETRTLRRECPRERLFVVTGGCLLVGAQSSVAMAEGDQHKIETQGPAYQLDSTSGPAKIVRLCGRWGDATGSSGVFHLENVTNPENQGDPVPYPRETAFDNHYHDCDEYWVIVEGRCAAVSEDRLFLLSPGDCLVTGAGHHHDIPIVVKPVTGVYFEGTLEGKMRAGHLWEHRDGPASPDPGRM